MNERNVLGREKEACRRRAASSLSAASASSFFCVDIYLHKKLLFTEDGHPHALTLLNLLTNPTTLSTSSTSSTYYIHVCVCVCVCVYVYTHTQPYTQHTCILNRNDAARGNTQPGRPGRKLRPSLDGRAPRRPGPRAAPPHPKALPMPSWSVVGSGQSNSVCPGAYPWPRLDSRRWGSPVSFALSLDPRPASSETGFRS
jgi:hypothetical protein